MPRKPKVSVDDLSVIATYFSDPRTDPEFHAEMKVQHCGRFEEEYLQATRGFSPPVPKSSAPYLILPATSNKQGIQLRVYFNEAPPVPSVVADLITDRGKWHGRPDDARINHSNLMFQLFECGFLLGQNHDRVRINRMIGERFS